jgi:hypothetical protein
MNWTWPDVQELPEPIYEALIAYLVEEQERTAARR